MDRKQFSLLLVKQREQKKIGKNELCRNAGFTFVQLQRIENASNNFNFNLICKYLEAVGAILVIKTPKNIFPISNYKQFVDWLINTRGDKLSVRKLADITGCSFSAIAHIEQGLTVISVDTFLKIVDAFGYELNIE